MFQIRGFGAADQETEGGSTQYDEVGEWQTGSGGGGSGGYTSPGPYAPRSPGTMQWTAPTSVYTPPRATQPPLVFPPVMPDPLPAPPAPPPVPVGPSDVPTAGTTVVPVGPAPGALYPSSFSPALKRGLLWGAIAGGAIGLAVLLLRR